MEPDRNERVFLYKATMTAVKQMLSQGVITAKEYNDIDTMIAEKYGVSLCSIFRVKTG